MSFFNTEHGSQKYHNRILMYEVNHSKSLWIEQSRPGFPT